MKKINFNEYEVELELLCETIRSLVFEGSLDECERLLCDAMCKYPHAPHPHNLYGIVLERKGKHPLAMSHFRAAWSLDASYAPANHNLRKFSSFFSEEKCAFNECDIKI